MGRPLVQAALRPCRRVIGVELSPELCAIAQENLARARAKLVCRDISIAEGDAGGYTVPDDVTVVFIFNSFDSPVVRAVLQQLRDSLERKPRCLSIVYGSQIRRPDLLAETQWLAVGGEVRPIDPGMRMVVYEYSPAESLNRKRAREESQNTSPPFS